jgi:magnesium chelatase subunit D
VREARAGHLVLFVVDASGSMAARQRMAAAKGAVLALLLQAYQRRDRVGLIAVRGEGASLLLPPTASVELAELRLRALPTGGRTPLAHVGLGGDPLADARAEATRLAERGIPALVVDSETGPVRLGLAGQLAAALRAPYLRLEHLGADQLVGAVRGAADVPAWSRRP